MANISPSQVIYLLHDATKTKGYQILLKMQTTIRRKRDSFHKRDNEITKKRPKNEKQVIHAFGENQDL